MKFLLIIAILLFPIVSQASQPKETYWLCYQVGAVSSAKKGAGDNTLVISNIHTDQYSHNYNERMAQFYKQIKQETKGRFVGQFEPKCSSFDDVKKAMGFREKNLLRAKHNNYHILNIEFKYDPNKAEQQPAPLY